MKVSRDCTLTQERILQAYERGYRVTRYGTLSGPKGNLKIKCYGKQRYPTFSTNWGGRVFSVPVHQFAAYCFYKKRSFRKDLVVRHLNGNTEDVSFSNIKLGNHSDNNLDKSVEQRKRAAKIARKSQGVISLNAKLTKAQTNQIKDFYIKLNGKKAPNGSVSSLARELDVCRTVIHRVNKGESYASYSD